MQHSKVGGPARSLTLFCTPLFLACSSPNVTLHAENLQVQIIDQVIEGLPAGVSSFNCTICHTKFVCDE